MSFFQHLSPLKKRLMITVAFCPIAFWLAGYSTLSALGVTNRFPGVLEIFEIIYFNFDDPRVRSKILLAAIVPLLAPLAVFHLLGKKSKSQHGDARWATKGEIHDAELFHSKGDPGILLGKHSGQYVTAKGNEHILLAAPTRSGKGVSVIVPNLLTFNGSVVCTDIKFENFKISSRFRESMGQQVFLFAPGSQNTHRWNVFDLVEEDYRRHTTLNTIANIICPTGQGVDTPMWSQEARALFTAAALSMIDTNVDLTLSSLAMWVKSNASSAGLKKFLVENVKSIDPIAVTALSHCQKMSPQHLSGIVSELTSKLEIYIDPLTAFAVSKSDFNIRDLRKKKMTIYLGATVKAISTIGPIFNLFFQMVSMLLTEELPAGDEPHQVLFLMDEFPALGEMNMIKKGIAYFAQYRLRFLIVTQGQAQLDSIYKKDGRREFDMNTAFKVNFATTDHEEAVHLSDSLGEETVTSTSRSTPSWFSSNSNRSETNSNAGRKMLLPQEVVLFPDNSAILRLKGIRPVMLDKIVYYKDKQFRGRFFNLENPEATAGLEPVAIPDAKLDEVMAQLTTLANTSIEALEEPATLDMGEGDLQPIFGENIDDLTEEDFGATVDGIYPDDEPAGRQRVVKTQPRAHAITEAEDFRLVE